MPNKIMMLSVWLLAAAACPASSAPAHATDLCLLTARQRSGTVHIDARAVSVKKGVRAILGHLAWTSHDALARGHRTNGPGALIDAAKICWHDKCQHAAEALDQVLWTSVTLGGGAGRKVGTDWTQSTEGCPRG
jgi:hypothetical protein